MVLNCSKRISNFSSGRPVAVPHTILRIIFIRPAEEPDTLPPCWFPEWIPCVSQPEHHGENIHEWAGLVLLWRFLSSMYHAVVGGGSIYLSCVQVIELFGRLQIRIHVWQTRYGNPPFFASSHSCIHEHLFSRISMISWLLELWKLIPVQWAKSQNNSLRHSKYSAILSKYTPIDCFFGDFAHWVFAHIYSFFQHININYFTVPNFLLAKQTADILYPTGIQFSVSRLCTTDIEAFDKEVNSLYLQLLNSGAFDESYKFARLHSLSESNITVQKVYMKNCCIVMA